MDKVDLSLKLASLGRRGEMKLWKTCFNILEGTIKTTELEKLRFIHL